MPREKILLFLALNMEEGDHELRNSGGLWKLEDAERLYQHLNFNSVRPMSDFYSSKL